MRINGTLEVDGAITGTAATQSPGDNSTKLATTAYADAAGGGSSPHALLDGTQNNDTVAQAPSRGSLVYGNSTPKWDEKVIGAANSVLSSDGTDLAWDTTPTVEEIYLNGRIAPSQLTTNTDDYNPTNFHTTFELSISSNGPINLTGLDAGVQGEIHHLQNDGVTHDITLKHATTSSAGNQFWLPNQADFKLHPRSSVIVSYDATATKWAVIGSSQETAGSGTVTTTGSPASGNLTKFSGATSVTNADLTGDVTTTGTVATTIANSAVTLAKIANAAASSKLVGSGSSGSGAAYSEITVGSGLTMSGTTISSDSSGASAVLVAFGAVTDAQIKALATPVTLISAPAAGKRIQVISGASNCNVTTNGGVTVTATIRYIGTSQTAFTAAIAVVTNASNVNRESLWDKTVTAGITTSLTAKGLEIVGNTNAGATFASTGGWHWQIVYTLIDTDGA